MVEQFNLHSHFTVAISHFVKQGEAQDFEIALKYVIQQAKTFKGYNSIQIIRPTKKTENEYLLLVRFDHQKNYTQWKDSNICRNWSEKLRKYIYKESEVNYEEGLEFWFSKSNPSNSIPPAKWKMTILTWLAIYPLILIFNFLVGLCFEFFPPFLKMLIVSIILVINMTYFVMPNITKIFAFWIFKN